LTVHRQEYTDSIQTGVYRQYTGRSIETVHTEEYADSTQTGVYKEYTDRSIQTVP
jgi:hypothetical protein